MKTRLLTKEDVAKLADLEETMKAVERGFAAFSAGRVMQPDYIAMPFASPRGELDFKAGYLEDNETISMKASSGGFVNNPSAFQLPAGMGTILLYDARSCALQCIMDGSLITGLRTGAAGAISVKYLARKNARVVTSIGTGNQARMQMRAIHTILPHMEIHAFDCDKEAMKRFQAEMEAELNVPVFLEKTKQEAVEQADILVSTTRGKGDVIKAAWVKKGTHIVAIGTDMRGKQEYDPAIFKGTKVVHDSTAQCSAKGETWHGLHHGFLKPEEIYGEIGELVLGQKAGRQTEEEITLFDSTGMAIQDNVTAKCIYEKALQQGVGTDFAFI